jgi:hypothetical protein
MWKPISVTKVACSCGYLARSAQDPNVPVKFDAELNEYSFEITSPSGAKISMIIYHCPLCGGVASESKRPELFATVSKKEAARLERITRQLKTVQDIETSLGAPDDDRTYSIASDLPEVRTPNGTREFGPIRQMTFARLSKTADVQFTLFSNNEVAWTFVPKYLAAQDRKISPSRKRRRRSSRWHGARHSDGAI